SIGAGSTDELFASIPPEFRLDRPLAVPEAKSEIELTRHLQQLAARNRSASDAVCFLGGGAYDHFIPSVVDAVAGRSEFYTASTRSRPGPGQASLRAFSESQTLISQLPALDVANASLYGGGTAVTEAVFMALGETKRLGKVLVAESVPPDYRRTLATYMHNLE